MSRCITIDGVRQVPSVPHRVYFFEEINRGEKELNRIDVQDTTSGLEDKTVVAVMVSRESVLKRTLTSSVTGHVKEEAREKKQRDSTFAVDKGCHIIASHLITNKHWIHESEPNKSEYLLLVTDANEFVVLDLLAMETVAPLGSNNSLDKYCSISKEKYRLVQAKWSSFQQLKEVCFVFQLKFPVLDCKSAGFTTRSFSEYDFEMHCLKNVNKSKQVKNTKSGTNLQSVEKMGYNDVQLINSFQLDQDYFVYLTSNQTNTTYKYHSLSTVDPKREGSYTFNCKRKISERNFTTGTYKNEPLFAMVTHKLITLYTVVTPDDQLWYLKNALVPIPNLETLGIGNIQRVQFSSQGQDPDHILVYGAKKVLKINIKYDHKVFAKTQILNIQKFDLPVEFVDIVGGGCGFTKDSKMCLYDFDQMRYTWDFDALECYSTKYVMDSIATNGSDYLCGASVDPWDLTQFTPYHQSESECLPVKHCQTKETTTQCWNIPEANADLLNARIQDSYLSKDKKTLFLKTSSNELYSNCQKMATHEKRHPLVYTKYCEWTVSHEHEEADELLVSTNYYNKYKNTEYVVYLSASGTLHGVEIDCESHDVVKKYTLLQVMDQKLILKTALINDTFKLTMKISGRNENHVFVACNQELVRIEDFKKVVHYEWPAKLESSAICDVVMNADDEALHVCTLSGEVIELTLSESSVELDVRRYCQLTSGVSECRILSNYNNVPVFYVANSTLYDLKTLMPVRLPYNSFWFCLQTRESFAEEWTIYTKNNAQISFTFNPRGSRTKEDSLLINSNRGFFAKELLLNSVNDRFSLVLSYTLSSGNQSKEFGGFYLVDLLDNKVLRRIDHTSDLGLPLNAEAISLVPLFESNETSSASSKLSAQVEQVFKKCFLVCLNYRDSGKNLRNQLRVYQFNEQGLIDPHEKALKLEYTFSVPSSSKIVYCGNYMHDAMPQLITINECGFKVQLWDIKYHPSEHRFEIVDHFASTDANTEDDVEESVVSTRSFTDFTVLPRASNDRLVTIGMAGYRSGSFQLIEYDLETNETKWLTKTEQLMCVDKMTLGHYTGLDIAQVINATEGLMVFVINKKRELLIVQDRDSEEFPTERQHSNKKKKRKMNPLAQPDPLVIHSSTLKPGTSHSFATQSLNIVYESAHIQNVVAIRETASRHPKVKLLVTDSNNCSYTVSLIHQD